MGLEIESIKTQQGDWVSFCVGEHIQVLGGNTPGEGIESSCIPSPIPCPMHLIHLAVPALYPL